MGRIGAAGVAVAPVKRIDQVFSDPQVITSGQVALFRHATLDDIHLVGSPLHLSRTPVHLQGPPPTLGQHTNTVLDELD